VPGTLEGSKLPVRSRLLAATDDQYDVLARWLAEVACPLDTLLDIGAGDGDDAYCHLIRPLVGRVVGVDPDPRTSRNTGLDEWHQATIEAFAAELLAAQASRARESAEPGAGPPSATGGFGLFDLALAVYVVEHVTAPAAFFSAARVCLRPGGSLFVITPNLWHYFGLLAKGAMGLGVEDRLLGAVRAAAGEHDHAAHFAVAYRANSVRALRRFGSEAGFSSLEIRHLENPAVFETYFPGWAVAFPRWYSRAVHRLGRPELFGTFICRFIN